MQIRNGKDFWAGTLYIAVGAFFMAVAQNYTMGSALRMGPAYFPTWLGGLLVLLGVVVFVRSFSSHIVESWRLFEFRKQMFAASVVAGGLAYSGQENLLDMGTWVAYLVNGIALILFFSSFGKRSLSLILLITIGFGYLLKPAGLVISTIFLVIGAALAGHEFKLKEVLPLAVFLAILGSVAFVYALGLPFPYWPEWR